jgi:uncharacterized membrane protein YphA (DoxX/SURF4 family)
MNNVHVQSGGGGEAGETGGAPRRLAWRFAAVYLTLFALATQVAGSLLLIPGPGFRGLGPLWPAREVTSAVARGVFGIEGALDPGGASGETAFFWVQSSWLLALALVLTVVWWSLDRGGGREGRSSELRWLAGFRVFLRLGLAAQMIEYGMTKVIPNQFEAPALTVLVTPAGDLSLNTMLWTSIGAAPAYQIFTGAVELAAGLLLLIGRNSTPGALLAMLALVQVFVLNMTYDIGLKGTSLHLVLIALFLLAPDLGRLVRFFFGTGETAAPAPAFRTERARRAALAAGLLWGAYLIVAQGWLNVTYWNRAGGGAPRSELYGIWDIGTLALDGVAGPASLNDYDRRWRRVIFDDPGTMIFQRTDDSFARYLVRIDADAGTLELTRAGSASWESSFRFEPAGADALLLEGTMDGDRIRMELERVRFDTFRLLNSHFRWVRPDRE